MALVERLMHLDPIESRNMSVHTFFAALNEMTWGNLTSTQIQIYYSMTTEDLVDWDTLVTLIPSVSSNKALFIEHIHAVFILAEVRTTRYTTPAEVRTRLGI